MKVRLLFFIEHSQINLNLSDREKGIYFEPTNFEMFAFSITISTYYFVDLGLLSWVQLSRNTVMYLYSFFITVNHFKKITNIGMSLRDENKYFRRECFNALLGTFVVYLF